MSNTDALTIQAIIMLLGMVLIMLEVYIISKSK